jgi:uncharacterized protein (TIGR02301 family)
MESKFGADHCQSKCAHLGGAGEGVHTPAVIRSQFFPMKLRAAFAVCTLLALTPAPALAQGAQTETTAPTSPVGGEPWYRQQLTDLASVLGGAHYLRILCEGRGDQRWRDYMRGVITREPNYERDLTAAFNQGYRQEESRFDDCDRDAQQGEAELRARGLRIADGLRARHTR